MSRPVRDNPWLRPGLLGLHALAVAAVVVCVVMGLWQLGAYDSRQAHEQADRRDVPRVAFAGLWGPDDPFEARLNHRPVTIDGRFAPATEQFWVTGKAQGDRSGAWLVAPLLVDGDDHAILYVRGWAPAPGTLPPVPEGAVSVEATLEPGEGVGTSFDPASRTIGSVRIPTLTNELPYDLYSGFALGADAAAAGALTLAAPPATGVSWTVGLRNLAYAVQWWVFGLFSVFMWWRMTTEHVAAERAAADAPVA